MMVASNTIHATDTDGLWFLPVIPREVETNTCTKIVTLAQETIV